MKNFKRENKGITLITITVAVIILIIISSILVYNAKNGIKMRSYNYLKNDITLLSDKINSFYVKYGKIPAEIQYLGNIDFEPEPNDNENYYVIDLRALEGISLNYGIGYNDITNAQDTVVNNDVYIINEQSYHIYYAKGIDVDGTMYYTIDNDDEIQLQDITKINITLSQEPENGTWTNKVELIGEAEVKEGNTITIEEYAFSKDSTDESTLE